MVVLYDTELDRKKHPVLVVKEEFNEDSRCLGTDDLFNMMCRMFRLDKKAEERIYEVAMNAAGTVTGVFEVGHGGIDGCPVDMRNIIRNAVIAGASSIALVHNHPAGSVDESAYDLDVHGNVRQACKLMNIEYADFVIIGDGKYTSFRERDLM